MKRIILFCFIGFFAFGCAGANIKEASAYIEKLNLQTEQNYTLNKQWWLAFNDSGLNALIELALANNADLAKAGINIKTALYQANLAGKDLFPAFEAGLGAQAERELKNGGASQQFLGNLSVNYEIDLFRKIGNKKESETWEYEAAVSDMEAVKLSLINNVIDVYFNIAYLNNASKAAQNNIDNYEKILEIAQAKHQSGKAEIVDVLQARQSLLSAQNTLLDLNSQTENCFRLLLNLLNLKPENKPEINFPDILDIMPLAVNLDAPLSVIAGRPDIMAAQQRLQSAFVNVKARQKGWYPQISLNGALSSSGTKADGAFSFPLLFGAVSVTMPFLDWVNVKNNIKISKAQYETARLNFESSVNTALTELAYFYAAYLNNKQTACNSLKKYVADAEITLYYKARYENGQNDMLDLLIVTYTENESKLALLADKYKVLKAQALIFKALGGDCKPM